MSEITKTERDCLSLVKEALEKASPELDDFKSYMDDKFLLHFVRGKKYQHEKAAKAVKNYWLLRKSQYKSVFLEIGDLDKGVKPIESGFLRPLRGRDNDRRRFIVVDFNFWPEGMTADDLARSFVLLLEEMWNCVDVERQGVSIIANLHSFGWGHIKLLTPMSVYRIVNIFWNNMPFRYKAVHLVNAGSVFGAFLKSVKPILPKTLRERLIIHDQLLSNLHLEISASKLPESLDGSLSDEDAFDNTIAGKILSKKEHYESLVAVLLRS